MLLTVVTDLEMRAPPARTPAPAPEHVATRLLPLGSPTVRYYRYLYDSVGAPWTWIERRLLDDDTLLRAISAPGVEIRVLYADGAPAGYCELARQSRPGHVDLVYFGLVPEWIGHGLGRYFLDATIDLAWTSGPDRLLVNTCDLDHPRALPAYRRAGFTVIGKRQHWLPDPRIAGLPLPPGRTIATRPFRPDIPSQLDPIDVK